MLYLGTLGISDSIMRVLAASLVVVKAPWTAELGQAARSLLFQRLSEAEDDVLEAAKAVKAIVRSIQNDEDAEVITTRYHLQAATKRLVSVRDALDMTTPYVLGPSLSPAEGSEAIAGALDGVRLGQERGILTRLGLAASVLFDWRTPHAEPAAELLAANQSTIRAASAAVLTARLEAGLICLPEDLLEIPSDPWAAESTIDLFEKYEIRENAIFQAFVEMADFSAAAVSLSEKIRSLWELRSRGRLAAAVEADDEVEVAADPDDVDGRRFQRVMAMVEASRVAVSQALLSAESDLYPFVFEMVKWLLASGETRIMEFFDLNFYQCLTVLEPLVLRAQSSLERGLRTRIRHRFVTLRMREQVEARSRLLIAARTHDAERINTSAEALIDARLRTGMLTDPERLLRVPMCPWLLISRNERFMLFNVIRNAITRAFRSSVAANTPEGIRLSAELDMVDKRVEELEASDAYV